MYNILLLYVNIEIKSQKGQSRKTNVCFPVGPDGSPMRLKCVHDLSVAAMTCHSGAMIRHYAAVRAGWGYSLETRASAEAMYLPKFFRKSGFFLGVYEDQEIDYC